MTCMHTFSKSVQDIYIDWGKFCNICTRRTVNFGIMLKQAITPFRRLKWGFLPVRRVVDEDIEEDTDELYTAQPSTHGISMSPVKAENSSGETYNSASTNTPNPNELVEYRDEAKRKWWKFFDEYEYRETTYVRSQHKPWQWFDPRDTPAERKLMIKLDVILVLYSMAAYWVKYLDQTNLNNAWTSPDFITDIKAKPNDLVNMQVLFNVGNIVFQIPFMYFLPNVPLNYVLPALDLMWSVVTIGLSQVNSVGQIKALRFFVGAFEAPSYMAYQYLFPSWIWHPDQLARRSMVYYFGQYLGVLTSGLVAGAVLNHLEGVGGYHAWRWIFIVDGAISAAIGLIGFYSIPGTPTDCYSIFLTDDEIRLARRKLKANHTAGRKQDRISAFKATFSPKLWREILSSWEFYILSIWNLLCWNNNNGSSGAYILWLKSLNRYSPGKLQNMSALTPGLGLLWLFLVSMSADLLHSRWFAIVWSQVLNVTGNVVLAVWNVSEGGKWFAWCIQYMGWAMAPSLYMWQADICRRDSQKRAVILVWMNMLAQASTAWMAVIVWRTVEAPRYLKGYSWTAACGFALAVWTFVVLWFYKWNEKRHARQNGIILYDSSKVEIPEPGSISKSSSILGTEIGSLEITNNLKAVEKVTTKPAGVS